MLSDLDQVAGRHQSAPDGAGHVGRQFLGHGRSEVAVVHVPQTPRELHLVDVVDVARARSRVDVIVARVVRVVRVGQVVRVLGHWHVVQQLQEFASVPVVADEDELDEDPRVAEPDDQFLDRRLERSGATVGAAVRDDGQVVDPVGLHRLQLVERQDVVTVVAVVESHLALRAAPTSEEAAAAGRTRGLGHDEVENLRRAQGVGGHLSTGHESGVQIGVAEPVRHVRPHPASVVREAEPGGRVRVVVKEADFGLAVVVDDRDPTERPLDGLLNGAVVVGVAQRGAGVDHHAALQQTARQIDAGRRAGLVEVTQADPGALDHRLVVAGPLADVSDGESHDLKYLRVVLP